MWFKDSWPELIDLRDSAVGTPNTFRIPGETFVVVSHATVVLTTSAVVANRFVSLDILDGDGTVTFQSMSGTALAASGSRRFSFAPNVSNVVSAVGLSELLPFPDSLLAPGLSLRFAGVNLDVGDQFSAAFLHLIRIPSGFVVPAYGSKPSES
jgi:hypothetical protein